ncbi:MAG: ABC transporter permease [Christensenellales bacterium]
MFTSFLVSAISISSIFLLGCLGEIIMEKSGHLNLGLPGIMCAGAAGACYGVYIYMSGLADPTQASYIVLILLALVFAVIFSALVGFIYSFLTITLRANQNITGLALTTFGTGLAQYFINTFPVAEREKLLPMASKIMSQGFPFADKLGSFGKIFFSHSIYVYLAIILAVVAAIILKRTRVGLHLRAVGESPATADATGINVTGYKYAATLIGSSVAGLGGLYYLMIFSNGIWENASTLEGLGWICIALVIFTLWRPLVALLGSLVFGGLYIARPFLNWSIPTQIFNMFPFILTIIVLIITSIFDSKSVQPPQSLGVNYFREDR